LFNPVKESKMFDTHMECPSGRLGIGHEVIVLEYNDGIMLL
jgi:hypothetical protein